MSLLLIALVDVKYEDGETLLKEACVTLKDMLKANKCEAQNFFDKIIKGLVYCGAGINIESEKIDETVKSYSGSEGSSAKTELSKYCDNLIKYMKDIRNTQPQSLAANYV